MPPFIDLTGQQFESLTYLERVGQNKHKQSMWKCRCNCGQITIVVPGKTKSCGCLSSRHLIGKNSITHGMRYTPEYNAWCKMISRCHNPNYPESKYYSERNIEVCKEWRQSFIAFYEHIGPKPDTKCSIDRIDNNGNYEPGNVRWANSMTQNNNTRRNHFVTIRGWVLTISQWARFSGIKPGIIYYRLQRGWSPEKSVFHPLIKN